MTLPRTIVAALLLALLATACGGEEPAASPEAAVQTQPAAADPTDVSPAGADEGVSQTLAPDPGGVAVEQSGTVAGGVEDTYTITVPSCCTGEALYASLSSADGTATLSVRGPGGDPLETDVTEATVDLLEPGDLTVVVTTSGEGTAYDLAVGISVNAS